jgi:hypothetical protein
MEELELHLVFVTPLLISAAIVEELEQQRSFNSSTIAAGSSNGVTNTRCRRVGSFLQFQLFHDSDG